MPGTIEAKTLKGVKVPHPEFCRMVEDACRKEGAANPAGFTEPQIAARLEPSDPHARAAIRNAVMRMVDRTLLIRGEGRGVFQLGPNIDEPLVARRETVETQVVDLLKACGGFATRTTILEEMEAETESEISALGGVLGRSEQIVRVRQGLYALTSPELHQIVQEGRWARERIRAAVVTGRIAEEAPVLVEHLGLTPLDDIPEPDPRDMLRGGQPRRPLADRAPDWRGAATELLLRAEFEHLGASWLWLRRLAGLEIAELVADPAMRAALTFALDASSQPATTAWCETTREALGDSACAQEALLVAAWGEIEDGEPALHEALIRPVYEALGELLNLDPVALSRGQPLRSARGDEQVNGY